MTRLACRYHDGQIQWQHDEGGPWFWKSREDAENIAFALRQSYERHLLGSDDHLEYALQIEAALEAYDADEDDNEEWRYETEMANG